MVLCESCPDAQCRIRTCRRSAFHPRPCIGCRVCMADSNNVRHRTAPGEGQGKPGDEVVWMEASPAAYDSIAIADEPEPAPVQAELPRRPRKQPRKPKPNLDIAFALMIVAGHAVGLLFVVPQLLVVWPVLVIIYGTGIVAAVLIAALRAADPGVLPTGETARWLHLRPHPEGPCAGALKTYWQHRLAFGLMPHAARREKEEEEKEGSSKEAGDSVEAVVCGARRDGTTPSAVCTTCLLVKPMRASHCAVTGRCIARMDHYCAWTGCPVGAGNHRLFLAFVAAMCLHLSTCACACLWVLFMRMHAYTDARSVLGRGGGASGWTVIGSASVLAAVCAGFACYTFVLLLAQLFNVATDTTVRERLRKLAGGGTEAAQGSDAAPWVRAWPEQARRSGSNCSRFWSNGM